MQANFYAIGLPSGRLVATQLDSHEAAEFLDAGQTVLLVALLDLVRLAARQRSSLTVFARDEIRGSRKHAVVERVPAADATRAMGRAVACDGLPLAG